MLKDTCFLRLLLSRLVDWICSNLHHNSSLKVFSWPLLSTSFSSSYVDQCCIIKGNLTSIVDRPAVKALRARASKFGSIDLYLTTSSTKSPETREARARLIPGNSPYVDQSHVLSFVNRIRDFLREHHQRTCLIVSSIFCILFARPTNICAFGCSHAERVSSRLACCGPALTASDHTIRFVLLLAFILSGLCKHESIRRLASRCATQYATMPT